MTFLMKTAAKLLLFTAIPCVLFAALFPFSPDGYMAAMPDKIKRAGEISQPKIIVVGDSNVAFGIDSAMLEAHFDMPVVNFGLHGGLGQAFHTELLRGQIKRGDIIVIAPSSCDSDTTRIADPILAWQIVESDRLVWSKIPKSDQKEMVKYLYPYMKQGVQHKVVVIAKSLILGDAGTAPSCYTKEAFDENGDNVFAQNETEITAEEILENDDFFQSDGLSNTMRDYWNEYNQYVKSKGAVLVMSVPPVMDIRLESEGQLVRLQNSLESSLEFPVISKFSDYVYPIGYFYDTTLHLNRRGKTVRTNQLILDLQAVPQVKNDSVL